MNDLSVQAPNMVFSHFSQNTVSKVQIRIREVDMALHPSVKSNLGEIRTFTYSTLAGCCDFLDSVQMGGYSNEVESFAKEIVEPTIKECFAEIEKYSSKIGDEALKLALANKLRCVQQYNFPGFKTDLSPELISKLSDVIKMGSFSFYKLKDSDEKYYGGIIHINNEAFEKAVSLMEEAGYKQEGDMVGSSFDVGAHVTTIFSRELSENYENIMSTHDNFISKVPNASLTPVSIDSGFPQSGILSKAVCLMLNSPEIDAYREACGLGKLVPPAHISIFSKVVKPLPELREVTFLNFINRETQYLSKLNKIFQSIVC